MECFAVDESGYTGFDLLNNDQQFQGASAVSISNEEAAALIKKHFPRLQTDELKYSSLTRRPNYREPLFNLQRDVLANHKCVTCVANKRFLLILMFLDYATEPWYYERGCNFYQDGQNYSLASLLYYTAPTFLSEERFNGVLDAFQKAVKEKSRDAVDQLVYRVGRSNWNAIGEAFGPIAKNSPECRKAIASPGVSTDAALVILQALINRMEAMSDGLYRVEHDRSTNLLQYHSLIQQFIGHKNDAQFTQSKIASIKFPLKLSEVTQVDSKDSPAVQIVDVLVGAAIEATKVMTKQKEADYDPETLIRLYREDQFIHYIPSLNFDEQKEFREGSQGADVIDYFSKNFKP